LLKENPPKMSEFLKNKYFVSEIFPSYNLIPEKTTFWKANVQVLPEFLKNKNFIMKNLLKNNEFF
jgi:hypothetical protein